MGNLRETNPSLWVTTTTAESTFLPLDVGNSGAPRVDVAVIGAGITGVVTAALLKASGATVALLEADEICSGVTGYTTAKITSLHGLKYDSLTKSHGEDAARAYGEANQAGLEQIASLVAAHGIECDFSRRDAFTYTEQPARADAIAAEVEAAQRLGLPASFTTETDLPYGIEGAVRFADQAQFHPRQFCLGLADALAGDGSLVGERTRVTGVKEGSPCVVQTEHGEVHADQVVLATHLPFLDRGGFFAKCHPMRSYALAARLSGPVPNGMYLSVDTPGRSVRSAQGDQVVILGGESHKVGQDDDTRQRYADLEEWSLDRFDVVEQTHRWSAQDLMSVDALPFVGRQLPGSKVFVATGFQKWGMSNGAAAGLIISDLIAGVANPWAPTFDATRQRSTLGRDLLKENANVGLRFVTDRVARMRAPSVDTLEPGTGAVVNIDGDRVAAYRRDDGSVCAVSAVCTHLKCIVAFNTAEKTWDCPCHGSRFTVEGKVIEGPALDDLAPHEAKS